MNESLHPGDVVKIKSRDDTYIVIAVEKTTGYDTIYLLSDDAILVQGFSTRNVHISMWECQNRPGFQFRVFTFVDNIIDKLVKQIQQDIDRDIINQLSKMT